MKINSKLVSALGALGVAWLGGFAVLAVKYNFPPPPNARISTIDCTISGESFRVEHAHDALYTHWRHDIAYTLQGERHYISKGARLCRITAE